MPATLEIATIWPPPAATIARQQCLGQRDRRQKVDTDDALIDLEDSVDRERTLRDAGVVDEAVDAPPSAAQVPGALDDRGMAA